MNTDEVKLMEELYWDSLKDPIDEYIDSWFNFEGIYKLDEPEEPKESKTQQLPF